MDRNKYPGHAVVLSFAEWILVREAVSHFSGVVKHGPGDIGTTGPKNIALDNIIRKFNEQAGV